MNWLLLLKALLSGSRGFHSSQWAATELLQWLVDCLGRSLKGKGCLETIRSLHVHGLEWPGSFHSLGSVWQEDLYWLDMTRNSVGKDDEAKKGKKSKKNHRKKVSDNNFLSQYLISNGLFDIHLPPSP